MLWAGVIQCTYFSAKYFAAIPAMMSTNEQGECGLALCTTKSNWSASSAHNATNIILQNLRDSIFIVNPHRPSLDEFFFFGCVTCGPRTALTIDDTIFGYFWSMQCQFNHAIFAQFKRVYLAHRYWHLMMKRITVAESCRSSSVDCDWDHVGHARLSATLSNQRPSRHVRGDWW